MDYFFVFRNCITAADIPKITLLASHIEFQSNYAMSYWIKTTEKEKLCFFLSCLFQHQHLRSFLPSPLRLSVSFFLSLSQNKADLCLWSSSSSSPPSVWPSLINIHPSLLSRGTESDFHFLFGWSSSQLYDRQQEMSLGCHLAHVLFTSIHLWDYKDFHSVFNPTVCIRNQLYQKQLQQTLKPHA